MSPRIHSKIMKLAKKNKLTFSGYLVSLGKKAIEDDQTARILK